MRLCYYHYESPILTLLFIQGGLGGAQTFANSEILVNMLKKQMETNRPYAAICASPALVLEPNGLLKVRAVLQKKGFGEK